MPALRINDRQYRCADLARVIGSKHVLRIRCRHLSDNTDSGVRCIDQVTVPVLRTSHKVHHFVPIHNGVTVTSTQSIRVVTTATPIVVEVRSEGVTTSGHIAMLEVH